MSDRTICNVFCPYCGKNEDDFYYAPGCGCETNICLKCRRKYFVVDCEAVKVDNVIAESLLEAFLDSLNMWEPTEQEKVDILEDYKKQIQEVVGFNNGYSVNQMETE